MSSAKIAVTVFSHERRVGSAHLNPCSDASVHHMHKMHYSGFLFFFEFFVGLRASVVVVFRISALVCIFWPWIELDIRRSVYRSGV